MGNFTDSSHPAFVGANVRLVKNLHGDRRGEHELQPRSIRSIGVACRLVSGDVLADAGCRAGRLGIRGGKVGRRARIGANAVVTDEVPEGATMIGLKARSTLVPAEEWVKEFIPYGTPCDDPCEPSRDCIEKLEGVRWTSNQSGDPLNLHNNLESLKKKIRESMNNYMTRT